MKQTDTSETATNAFMNWVEELGGKVNSLYESGTLQLIINDDGKVGFRCHPTDFAEFLSKNLGIFISLAQTRKDAIHLNPKEGIESKLEDFAFDYVKQNLGQAIHLAVVKTITESFLFAYDEVITPTETQATKSALRHLDLFFGEQYRQRLQVKLRGKGKPKREKSPSEIIMEQEKALEALPKLEQKRNGIGDTTSSEYLNLSQTISRTRKKSGIPRKKKNNDT